MEEKATKEDFLRRQAVEDGYYVRGGGGDTNNIPNIESIL